MQITPIELLQITRWSCCTSRNSQLSTSCYILSWAKVLGYDVEGKREQQQCDNRSSCSTTVKPAAPLNTLTQAVAVQAAAGK